MLYNSAKARKLKSLTVDKGLLREVREVQKMVNAVTLCKFSTNCTRDARPFEPRGISLVLRRRPVRLMHRDGIPDAREGFAGFGTSCQRRSGQLAWYVAVHSPPQTLTLQFRDLDRALLRNGQNGCRGSVGYLQSLLQAE